MHAIACSAITSALDAGLADLRITIRDAIGTAFMWQDPDLNGFRKEIGRITVAISTGLIEIWPAEHVTLDDLDVLRGAAFEATWQPQNEETKWSLVHSKTRGEYWESAVVVAVGATDPLVRAYRTALTIQKKQNQLLSQAFDSAA